ALEPSDDAPPSEEMTPGRAATDSVDVVSEGIDQIDAFELSAPQSQTSPEAVADVASDYTRKRPDVSEPPSGPVTEVDLSSALENFKPAPSIPSPTPKALDESAPPIPPSAPHALDKPAPLAIPPSAPKDLDSVFADFRDEATKRSAATNNYDQELAAGLAL